MRKNLAVTNVTHRRPVAVLFGGRESSWMQKSISYLMASSQDAFILHRAASMNLQRPPVSARDRSGHREETTYRRLLDNGQGRPIPSAHVRPLNFAPPPSQ